MSREKTARRNKLDPGFRQGISYNTSPIPGAPENTGTETSTVKNAQNNMIIHPNNLSKGEDDFSQPSLDGTVSGIYPDRHDLGPSTARQLGAVVNDIPRSRAQQGYDSVSTRGLNQLPISQTPPTPDAKGAAYLEANRLNADSRGSLTAEIMSPMGQVGLQAPMPGSSNPEATPQQNTLPVANSLGFTSDPAQSLVPGANKTTIQKKSRGIA